MCDIRASTVRHATAIISVLIGVGGSFSAPGADAPVTGVVAPRLDLASDAESGQLRREVEQLLWWLPDDTESLIISHGRIHIEDFDPFAGVPPSTGPRGIERLDATPARDFEDLMAAQCIEPLADISPRYPFDVRPRMMKEFFDPGTATLFAKAVRFDKDGIAESCDIVMFRDRMAARMVDRLAVPPVLERRHSEVAVYKIDLNDGRVWPAANRWLAAPAPDTFVVTTSEALMKSIVERMKHRGTSRALPSELSVWQQLDPAAPAWAVRHYRARGVDADPTSMLKRDPDAKGLVLFCGREPSPFVALRYVSANPDAGRRFMQMRADLLGMNTRRLAPEFLSSMQRVNAEVVEERCRVNVTKEDALMDDMALTPELTFHIMHMTYRPLFGFR